MHGKRRGNWPAVTCTHAVRTKRCLNIINSCTLVDLDGRPSRLHSADNVNHTRSPQCHLPTQLEDVPVSTILGTLSALEALCDYALYKSTFTLHYITYSHG